MSMVIPRVLGRLSGWYHYLNKVDLQKASEFYLGHIELKVTLDIQIRKNRRLKGFIFKSQVKDRGTNLKTLSILLQA